MYISFYFQISSNLDLHQFIDEEDYGYSKNL